jgi:hypothetical protein
MSIFNHIGMLLSAYLALYCAHRSAKAYLNYQQLNCAQATAHELAFQDLSRQWTKMVSWLAVGLIFITLVFKLAPH